MHELSIAVGIVDAVMAEAEQRSMRTVSKVYLRLGSLAGIDREALLFSFPIASEGTVLDGAELVVEEVPIRILCETCSAEGPPPSIYNQVCARCGGASTRVVAGNELELRGFEACEEVQT